VALNTSIHEDTRSGYLPFTLSETSVMMSNKKSNGRKKVLVVGAGAAGEEYPQFLGQDSP
jgi:hypothetical protein